jgi:hypothetical protein
VLVGGGERGAVAAGFGRIVSVAALPGNGDGPSVKREDDPFDGAGARSWAPNRIEGQAVSGTNKTFCTPLRPWPRARGGSRWWDELLPGAAESRRIGA